MNRLAPIKSSASRTFSVSHGTQALRPLPASLFGASPTRNRSRVRCSCRDCGGISSSRPQSYLKLEVARSGDSDDHRAARTRRPGLGRRPGVREAVGPARMTVTRDSCPSGRDPDSLVSKGWNPQPAAAAAPGPTSSRSHESRLGLSPSWSRSRTLSPSQVTPGLSPSL